MSTRGDRGRLRAGWGVLNVLPLQVVAPQVRAVVVVPSFHIQALKDFLSARKTEPPTKAGGCELNELPLPSGGDRRNVDTLQPMGRSVEHVNHRSKLGRHPSGCFRWEYREGARIVIKG